MRANDWREARDLFRTYGARGIALRGQHELRRRAGLYRRLTPRAAPAAGWTPLSVDLTPVQRFFADHSECVSAAVQRADAMVAGQYPFFQGPAQDIGWPPRWLVHARTDASWPGDQPWWEVSTTDLALGDIKWIWEPARFGFAWCFARAAVASGETARWWTELWRGIDDFLATCPPYRGPNWYCAQEASLRILALEFALGVFAALGQRPTAAQQRTIEQLYWDTGRRIAATLGHSLSQRNNHAISELVGLWAVAIACPRLPHARTWLERVERELPRVLRDQFAADGAYIQESFVYQRFALHLLLLLRWTSERRQTPCPAPLGAIFEASFAFLSRAADPASGLAPNFGANDGTLLLPLSAAAFRDLRPLLAHLGGAIRRDLPFAAGPWDEERCWFSVAAARSPRSSTAARLHATPSGYVWLRGRDSLAFARVPDHTDHRPSHADALHVDLFVHGRNVLLDPGTFAYTAAPPWNNGLARTRVHNTASVDDRDQMRRRGRFLWTRWTRAELLWAHDDDQLAACLARCHADPLGLVAHRRLVVHADEGLHVFDALDADRPRRLRIHWNLEGTWTAEEPGDGGARLRSDGVQISVEAAQRAVTTVSVADPRSTQGWLSPTYGQRVPCTAVELESQARATRFLTSVLWGEKTVPAWLADVRDAWNAGRISDAMARIERR